MSSVSHLVAQMSGCLCVHPANIAWLAERHLRKAGLLPPENSDAVTPLHAARLLTAALAVQRPIDTLDAIDIYSTLPARRKMKTKPTPAGSLTTWDCIEDLKIVPGGGHAFNLLTGNFISALTELIDLASRVGTEPEILPRFITVSRDLDNPFAIIEADVTVPGESAYVTLIYGRGDDALAAAALGDLRLQVIGRTSGAIIRSLGALFADGNNTATAKPQALPASAPANGVAQ